MSLNSDSVGSDTCFRLSLAPRYNYPPPNPFKIIEKVLAWILLYGYPTSRARRAVSPTLDQDGYLVAQNIRRKKMRTLKTIPAIFAPVFLISYLFSMNVIKVEAKRSPAFASNKMENQNVEPTKTWYAN